MTNKEKLDKFFEIHKEQLEKGFIDEHDKWDITYITTNTLVEEYVNMYNIFNTENPIEAAPYRYNDFCKATLEIIQKHIYKLDIEELTNVTEGDFISYLLSKEQPLEALMDTSEDLEASKRAVVEIINKKIKEKMKEIYSLLLLPELVVHKLGIENVMKVKDEIIQSLNESGKTEDIKMMNNFYATLQKVYDIN
jgi:hypothetical protein